MIFVGSGCVCKVLRFGVLLEAEEITPGREQNLLSMRRDGVVDSTHDIGHSYERPHTDGVRKHSILIVNNVHFHLTKLLRGQIDRKKMTALRESDRGATQRRPINVVILEIRKLIYSLAIEIKAPDIAAEVTAAVGKGSMFSCRTTSERCRCLSSP